MAEAGQGQWLKFGSNFYSALQDAEFKIKIKMLEVKSSAQYRRHFLTALPCSKAKGWYVYLSYKLWTLTITTKKVMPLRFKQNTLEDTLKRKRCNHFVWPVLCRITPITLAAFFFLYLFLFQKYYWFFLKEYCLYELHNLHSRITIVISLRKKAAR